MQEKEICCSHMNKSPRVRTQTSHLQQDTTDICAPKSWTSFLRLSPQILYMRAVMLPFSSASSLLPPVLHTELQCTLRVTDCYYLITYFSLHNCNQLTILLSLLNTHTQNTSSLNRISIPALSWVVYNNTCYQRYYCLIKCDMFLRRKLLKTQHRMSGNISYVIPWRRNLASQAR